MKKTFTFLIFSIIIFSSQVLFSQPWSEDFNSQTSGSYGTGTITISGRDWTRKEAGNFSYANTNMGSYAFTINDDKAGAHVTSPALNTCGSVNFKYAYKNGNSSNVFVLQKSYDNSSWTNLDTHTLGSSADLSYVNYSFDVNDDAGTIYIRILSDDQNAHLFIEDFSVTAYSVSSNDTDAEAADTGSQPAAGTISSVNNDDSNNPVDVFNMDIYDWGTSDGLPTKVTNIRLKPKNTNTASWATNIAGVIVDDGTNYLTPNSVTITDTEIDIAFSSTELNVADNSTTTVNIGIYLNTSDIEDGKILSFMVDVDDHGFTADASGTGFKSVFDGGDFYSNDFTIDVEATEMQYQQQPTDVEQGAVMSPAVTVAYTDENGNVDVDYDGAGIATTSVTTTGTFDGSATTTVDAVQGIATFDNLVFSAQGTGLTLTATDDNDLIGTSESVTSNTFDVTPPPAAICYEQHFDGNVPDGWVNNGTANETTGIHAGDAANCRQMKVNTDIVSVALDYPEQLEFYQDASGAGDGNTATVEYKIGSGGTWTSLYSFTVTTDGKTETVDLTDVDGVDLSAQQEVYFKFISSFNSWYLDDVVVRGGSCTLPLALLDFDAKKINNTVLLSWSTSSEISNDYFSVEWSKDGKYFTEIAKIESKSNYRENKEYSYTHENPANGTNYYRLTQYDIDGRSETFKIVSVYFDLDGKAMFIAPNRVDDNLRVEFAQPVENGRLLIYSLEGQLVQSNILAKGIDIVNIDVAGLVAGQYIVKYVDSNITLTEKFVKL